MLSHLNIRNFTIISQLALDFEGGFSALTGETGTGKSIVVDALALALGNRADSDCIRDGCEECEISAVFSLADVPDARRWLGDNALLLGGNTYTLGDSALANASVQSSVGDSRGDSDANCILRRLLHRTKPGRAFINDTPVTLRQLRALGIHLADIHGQHEHQALLRRDQQRRVVDDFCAHEQQLSALVALHQRHAELQAALEDVERGASHEERLEYLDYQIQELQGLGLVEGESASLDVALRRLANAGDLQEGMQNVLEILDGNEEHALSQGLGRARTEMRRLMETDPSLADSGKMLDDADRCLNEVIAHIRDALERADSDPKRLREVEARIGALHDVARKHRVQADALLPKLASLQKQRAELAGRAGNVQKWRDECAQLMQEYAVLASKISARRQQAARELHEAVSAELRELGMPGAEFTVDIQYQPQPQPTPSGWDRVEFVVRTNPGQTPRPLARVASGGELSRISLAIRVASDAPGPIPTLIFDEVDSGAGGRTAHIIGGKVRTLAGNRQILCITHLPQVAAHGHHHYKVNKNTGQSLAVSVQAMDDDERVRELGRMIGGNEVTDKALAHARELLRAGQQ